MQTIAHDLKKILRNADYLELKFKNTLVEKELTG